jgi:hypothetical protein
MKRITAFLMLALVAVASYGVIPNLDDNFDGYADGTNFLSSLGNWQASSAAAYVTNGGAYANKAVFMGQSVALSNTLNADSSLTVWTHMRVKPMLGVEVSNSPTNTSSFCCYFNSNGFVTVATPSGWRVCSNDVWGGVVEPATNDYVQLSVWQNYTIRTQAFFLNGRLIVQDLGFVGSAVSNSQLVIENADSNCWLDTVWVKTNYNGYDSSALTNDLNGISGLDADELNAFNYVARRLYVSTSSTNLTPYFSSITSALAAWRPRDIIHVFSGNYSAETIVLAANPSNVIFEGDAFTVASLTVASGASAAFEQAVTCSGSLSVSGQVAMAQSTTLTSGVATVVGTVTMASNATFAVGGALTVGTNGRLDFTNNAHFAASTAGVEMNGTFTLSNTWTLANSQMISMPLPFGDNFDSYKDGTVVTNLKFRGWYASDGAVKVQTTVAHSGSGNAVVLPDGTVLSNSISASDKKIWTDYFIRPAWGVEPSSPPTDTSSFVSYVNTNGFLVVYGKGQGWIVCSNKLDAAQSAVTPLASNGFTRVTVCQDLNAGTFAVFIASNLVAQGLSSPTNLNAYASFVADNRDGSAYLDDVLIATAIPDGLSTDLDGDGIPDAWEINNGGLTTGWPKGTIYKFR